MSEANVTKIITKKENMKLGSMANPEFMTALSKLSNMNIEAKTGYWVGKSLTKIKSHLKDYDETRVTALKKYCELDEKKELVVDENGGVKFKDDEAQEAFGKEIGELLLQEVEVLKVSSEAIFKDVKDPVTPAMLSSLDELLY